MQAAVIISNYHFADMKVLSQGAAMVEKKPKWLNSFFPIFEASSLTGYTIVPENSAIYNQVTTACIIYGCIFNNTGLKNNSSFAAVVRRPMGKPILKKSQPNQTAA